MRWVILQQWDVPIGLAGIFNTWRDPHGQERRSFAMLTVNATGHVVFERMHKPGDEKRMVVLLHPDEYDDWLTSPVNEAPKFFRQWTGPLLAEPAPLQRGRPADAAPADG